MFTLVFDILSRILSKAEVEEKIHGLEVDKTNPVISHLMYADNLKIYCKASVDETKELTICLDLFNNWFGQVVNHSKSLIHFSKNTGQDLRANILNYLDMIYSHNSKYLDLLFCRYNSKSQVFRDIIDKVESKLAR